MKKRFGFIIVCALIMATLIGAGSALAEPWKFGVMSDTQWKANVDGKNPATVAVGIINQLNQEFIKHGVKFVIQVGDLTDKEADPAMDTRAAAAQALYDAGIGFFPLRGNHEASQAAALKFQTIYPQAVGQGAHVFGAKNFSSPFASLDGLRLRLRLQERAIRVARPVHQDRQHQLPWQFQQQHHRPAGLD